MALDIFPASNLLDFPNSPTRWAEYQTWRAEGNDPLDYPPEGVPVMQDAARPGA